MCQEKVTLECQRCEKLFKVKVSDIAIVEGLCGSCVIELECEENEAAEHDPPNVNELVGVMNGISIVTGAFVNIDALIAAMDSSN